MEHSSRASREAGNCKPALQICDASIKATVGQPGSLHGPSRRQPQGSGFALYSSLYCIQTLCSQGEVVLPFISNMEWKESKISLYFQLSHQQTHSEPLCEIPVHWEWVLSACLSCCKSVWDPWKAPYRCANDFRWGAEGKSLSVGNSVSFCTDRPSLADFFYFVLEKCWLNPGHRCSVCVQFLVMYVLIYGWVIFAENEIRPICLL